ncbi:NACHT domain-containing protein [Aquimarina sp. MMG016]|uniref:NACHT domain-containing protein n=1 Tax=Aquimarina sp. MMG016 TaxID=2822690 RepID=UPI001B39D33C|nr:NACHT domain-containing protein [Aquimarina sp. MMG016]MBQ4821517.1 NACHT domain-containing protein [Aquimarina sp. MMG016]
MSREEIKNLDKLFQSYNFRLYSKSNEDIRIYTLRYGMYHAVEIIKINPDADTKKVREEFTDIGYATQIRKFEGFDEIEEYLFEGFFIKTPLGNELQHRYDDFVKKQLVNLPEKSTYRYINSSYNLTFQDENRNSLENKTYNGVNDITILDKINLYLSEITGAIFIIIEAPAGFGKTCTANEILNTFSTQESKKLPFFTELSRNREARIFKHILLNEIDSQFPDGIKQNIVLEQITKGRIPLIIDGFDELISKESQKEDVESMLTTIVELLKEEAKIVITSRKTAIFNSEEFLNSIYDSTNKFSLAQFEIKEPTIENWLTKERIQLLEESQFPLSNVANPVLLSYIRNIPLEKFKSYLSIEEETTLIDKYIDYLLKREQERQNIKLKNEEQLHIYRKLIRFFTEFDITSETKDTIKDFIKEYNITLLKESLNDYIAEEKPSLDDLVETLSNHAFLDKKDKDNIGFVNDFIFGLLVGENLILKKYQEHYSNYKALLPQDFATKAVQSFKVQSENKVNRLWEEFDDSFTYSSDFFFDLDYSFKKPFNREYNNLFISDKIIIDVVFNGSCKFKNAVFSNCTFKNVTFNLSRFKSCTFQNCSFYNCSGSFDNSETRFNDFALFACVSDNSFTQNVIESFDEKENIEENSKELSERDVLSFFFQSGQKKARYRKLSYIKKALPGYSNKEISKVIDSLKTNNLIHFKDDVGFITREAIYKLKHNEL